MATKRWWMQFLMVQLVHMNSLDVRKYQISQHFFKSIGIPVFNSVQLFITRSPSTIHACNSLPVRRAAGHREFVDVTSILRSTVDGGGILNKSPENSWVFKTTGKYIYEFIKNCWFWGLWTTIVPEILAYNLYLFPIFPMSILKTWPRPWAGTEGVK